MKTMKITSLYRLLILLILVPMFTFGQAAMLLTTTLSQAVTSISQKQFVLASVAGIAVGNEYYVGGEAGTITAIDSTNKLITVNRGVNGTNAQPHNSSDTIWVDKPSNFYTADPINGGYQPSRCIRTPTATNPNPNGTFGQGPVTPWINIRNGNIWDCDPTTNAWKLANVLHGQGGFGFHAQGNASYTALYSDTIIDYTTASTGRTLTLPDVTNIYGKIYILRNDSGQTITIQGTGGQTVEGAASVTVSTAGASAWVSNGGAWVRVFSCTSC